MNNANPGKLGPCHNNFTTWPTCRTFFFGKTNFFFAANDNIKRVMEQPAIIDLSAGAAIDSAPAKLTFTNLILTSGRRVCASKVAN